MRAAIYFYWFTSMERKTDIISLRVRRSTREMFYEMYRHAKKFGFRDMDDLLSYLIRLYWEYRSTPR